MDRCLMCGNIVIEGRMLCHECDNGILTQRCNKCNEPVLQSRGYACDCMYEVDEVEEKTIIVKNTLLTKVINSIKFLMTGGK